VVDHNIVATLRRCIPWDVSEFGNNPLNFEDVLSLKLTVRPRDADFVVIDNITTNSDAPPDDVVEVFVTSQTYTGRLRGLVGARAICDNLAFQAELGTEIGDWEPWLSFNGNDARDRISDGRYELLNGTVIADDLADLTDGTLDAPIDRDENNETVTVDLNVWTGTASDGTWSTAMSGTCAPDPTSGRPWTSEDPTRFGGVGRATATGGGWTRVGEGGNSCDMENRLYCFRKVPEPGPLPSTLAALAALGVLRLGRRKGSEGRA